MFTYGHIKDIEDVRDWIMEKLNLGAPPTVDLRPKCPPVYDQGALGSCTSNAISFLYQFDLLQNHDIDFLPSRLFLYYHERFIEGTAATDSGAQIRDGMKVMNATGLAAERWWPYDVTKFAVPPASDAMVSAFHHKSIKYLSVKQDEGQLKQVLATGQPIAFGFSVFTEFESDTVATTGIVALPGPDEEVIGGHAVAMVGYDDSKRSFLVRNSWGEEWGLKGHFWLPYAYVLDPNLASDFWVLNTITG